MEDKLLIQQVFERFTKFGDRMILAIKLTSKKLNKIATQKTINSLDKSIQLQRSGVVELDIFGSIVFQYQEQGRRAGAKLPPQGSLIKSGWMAARRIEEDKEFLIRRAIARDGIKPVPVITLSLKAIEKEFQDKVQDQLLQNVGRIIAKSIQDGFQFPNQSQFIG